MSTQIFNEWLSDFDKRITKEKRKIVLIMDNCTVHNSPPRLQSIDVRYLPPNCTSILQPLDMGIIKCFKCYYRRRLVEKILILYDTNTNLTINIKEACDEISGSWKEVTSQTIKNCSKKAGFIFDTNDYIDNNEDEINAIDNLRERIVQYNKDLSSETDIFVEVDDDLQLYSENTDEEILQDIQKAKDIQEEDDEVPSVAQKFDSIFKSEEAIEALEKLKRYLASFSQVQEKYFHSLDEVQKFCIDELIAKNINLKQTKITDFLK